MSLTVGLDVRELAGGVSGDRTYWRGLLQHLLAGEDRLLLYHTGEPPDLRDLPAGGVTRRVDQRPGWLWTPWAWPRELRRDRVQVAHAQYLVPPLAPCPTVVTIHDVSFLTHPEWFPARQLRIMRWLIPLSARRATRVVTGSAHAAGELVATLRLRPERVLVLPYAAAPRFQPVPADARDEVLNRLRLRAPFVLAVGLLQPRKNLGRLLQAFAAVAPRVDGLTLVLAGRSGWGAAAVQEQVAALGVADRVRLAGAVADEDLPALYSGCAAFVYPSLYEGFGLPPLEALACGAPVICSNTTSLPEVVGDAAVTIDPLDVAALGEALAAVVTDPALASRLRAAGPPRAARFSWAACAAGHRALYQELAGQAT